MNTGRVKVLFLAKWYLHRNDPQFAVYITKHAHAISAFADVAVLHVMSDEKLTGKVYEEVITDQPGRITIQVYFKKNTGYFSKIIHAFRYFRGTRKGLATVHARFGDYDIVHAYILLRPAIVAYLL